MSIQQTPKHLSPSTFYKIADSIQTMSEPKTALLEIEKDVDQLLDDAHSRFEAVATACNQMNQEHRMNSRRERPLEVGTADSGVEDMSGSSSFLRTSADLLRMSTECLTMVREIIDLVKPAALMLPPKDKREDFSLDGIQRLHFVMQANSAEIDRFVRASLFISEARAQILERVKGAANRLDGYYRVLLNRHEVEGIQIHGDAVITDVAMHIYENVDSHGEVAAGKDEISAYSMRKAKILAEAINGTIVWQMISQPGNLVDIIRAEFREAWELMERVQKAVGDRLDRIRMEAGFRPHNRNARRSDVEAVLRGMDDIDPQAITYKETAKLRTPDERFNLRFRNETLQKIVSLIREKAPAESVIQYIVQRKAALRKYFHEENSFYTCSISAGNPFLGEAPGALKVDPSPRPRASFDSIRGEGFAELRDFVHSVKSASKFHSLFVATSPSGTADKSNVLLIGPQGCGKCVAGDTLVYTDAGLVRIDSLNPGVNDDGYGELKVGILSVDGMSTSAQFYDSGVQETICVSSRHGYGVEGTDKHRLICAGPSGPEWRRLDEIRFGDYVAVVREGLPFGLDDSRAEAAYVYGYYVGDGSTSGPASKPRAIRFSVFQDDLADFETRAIPYLRTIGKPKAYPDGRGNKCVDLQVWGMGPEAVARFREECGHGASNKRVPEWVMKSGRATWKSFLQGLFDADGSAYGRRVELSSNSHGLVKTVQTMLLGFGIVSTVQNKESNPRCWRLFVYGENMRRFAKEVGFGLPRKNEALGRECESTTRNDNYDVVPVPRILWARLKEESGPLSREVHKSMDHYARAGHMPGRRVLLEILESVPDCQAKRDIESLASDRFFWDMVESVEAGGEKPVFDLVVPHGESFAANGFMNHNTEAMRALASEKDSIAIFATGSDFMTCWKGEAQKNPKRLFEAALKLQGESKRHVHILIDEIDAVLKRKEFMGHGDEDLTTEFQNLMDGVVAYPHISVWGATNHPERIPMPMIRRFNKVLIVGELSNGDRTHLLKQFLSPLPDEVDETTWARASNRLEGATGDVVRKVADYVWRSKMAWFTAHHPDAAGVMSAWLSRGGGFDPAALKGEEREAFKAKLSEWVKVTPRDIDASVELHLKNVAVSQEIKTAKESYKKAREFVTDLSSGSILVVAG